MGMGSSVPESAMTAPKTIIVKLRDEPRTGNQRPKHQDVGSRAKRIVHLVGPGLVVDARPLFPEEKEDSLASLYEVVLINSASVEDALANLNKSSAVEYAHTPQQRLLQ
jgi:hypothetical protein